MTDTDVVLGKPDRPDDDRPLVDEQLADELLGRAQAQGAELLGPDGLLSQVTKAVLERALGEELTQHLGYDKHDPGGRGSGNSRNGTSGKRLLTEVGIIALYARGMSTRDIRAHLRQMYDVEVSPDLISRVTDAVVEELAEWRSDPRYSEFCRNIPDQSGVGEISWPPLPTTNFGSFMRKMLEQYPEFTIAAMYKCAGTWRDTKEQTPRQLVNQVLASLAQEQGPLGKGDLKSFETEFRTL